MSPASTTNRSPYFPTRKLPVSVFPTKAVATLQPPAPTHPKVPLVPVERWVIFERGLVAHLLDEDDFFPAERTRCGRLPVDADRHRLPRFNSRPADYLFCLRCLPPRRVAFRVPLPTFSPCCP